MSYSAAHLKQSLQTKEGVNGFFGRGNSVKNKLKTCTAFICGKKYPTRNACAAVPITLKSQNVAEVSPGSLKKLTRNAHTTYESVTCNNPIPNTPTEGRKKQQNIITFLFSIRQAGSLHQIMLQLSVLLLGTN